MQYIITGQHGKLGTAFIRKNEKLRDFFQYVDGDLIDPNSFTKIDFDSEFIVIHFAGQKGNDAFLNLRNNILVLLQVLNSIDINNCRGFIYISSIAAIGNPNGVIKENSECNPVSEYGFAKYECERIIKNYLKNVPYVIIRPTNVFESIDEGVFHDIKESIKGGAVFEAWEESLRSKRDYIFIDDVIKYIGAILEEVEKGKIKTAIVNLGSGYAYSLREIICFFEKKYKNNANLSIKPAQGFMDYDVCIDKEPVNRYIDWEFTDLKEMIQLAEI